MDQTKKIIEAALFMSGRWMDAEELKRVAGSGQVGSVQKILKELKEEYDRRDGGINMSEIDGRYRLEIEPNIRDKVYYLAPEPELSPALIKTLALIAYKQPIYQSAVVKVIGNRAYEYIKELRKKEFIKIKKKGRTKLITTTGRFRKYFALQDGEDWRPEMDTQVLKEAQKRLDEVIEDTEIDEDYDGREDIVEVTDDGSIEEQKTPGDSVQTDN